MTDYELKINKELYELIYYDSRRTPYVGHRNLFIAKSRGNNTVLNENNHTSKMFILINLLQTTWILK